MTNRKRAIELWKNIKESHNQILYDFRIPAEEKGLEIDEASVKLIEQALSEPRPYFDGEFYHIPYYMQELSSKFMNEKVVPYAEVSEFVDDWNEYTLHAIGKRGFHFADELPGVFPFIAIQKETYERVMGEGL